MPLRPAPLLRAPLLLACCVPALAGAQQAPFDGTRYAQMTLRQRVVIRVPRVGPPPTAATLRTPDEVPLERWREKGAPRCVPAATLTGASIDREGEVDLTTSAGKRLRAKLDDDCPALDFYSGFYLRPDADDMVCARRDVIRARSGARCAITGFKSLVARR